MVGTALGLTLFAASIAAFAGDEVRAQNRPAATTGATQHVVEVIGIDGSINAAVASFIEDSLSDASQRKAEAMVIELDTPGGLMSSAQRIVKELLGAKVPVIVYVAPSGASAASAGTFVTLAANVAAMAPGTTIGAAHPIALNGGNLTGALGHKLENFTASFAESIARARGRNQKWVEDAVRNSAAIGERRALELHVVDIIARDLNDLLIKASGLQVNVAGNTQVLELAGATIYRRDMSLSQKILNTLADPNLVYLLLTAGLLGLYFEFVHPGTYFPGVVGAICLLLAMASFEVLPINVTALLLLLLGVALLIAEAFVPSYGVVGIGGLVAFVLGSLFFIDSSQSDLHISRSLIAAAALVVTVIFFSLSALILRWRKGPVMTGSEGLIGEVGQVREAIAPGIAGRIFVHGETWRAVSKEPIAAGERAQIAAVKGMEVEVRRPAVEKESPALKRG